MATSRILKRPRILLAYPEASWVAQARVRLEALGYAVTDCLDLSIAADLIGGTRPFELAAVSNGLDPDSQLRILKHLKSGSTPTKLMLLLDALDSATQNIGGGRGGLLTHRVSDDVDAFARAVAAAVGPAPRSPGP